MGIARQVGKHRLWPRKWLLDVDEPLLPAQRFERGGKGAWNRELGEAALQGQTALAMGGGELLQREPPEQPRQDLDRQEEAAAPAPARDEALAIKRQPAAGRDHVHVRMVGERRAPSVEHRREADARAQMLGIGGDGEHGLRCRLEQKAVDQGLVLPGDGANRRA